MSSKQSPYTLSAASHVDVPQMRHLIHHDLALDPRIRMTMDEHNTNNIEHFLPMPGQLETILDRKNLYAVVKAEETSTGKFIGFAVYEMFNYDYSVPKPPTMEDDDRYNWVTSRTGPEPDGRYKIDQLNWLLAFFLEKAYVDLRPGGERCLHLRSLHVHPNFQHNGWGLRSALIHVGVTKAIADEVMFIGFAVGDYEKETFEICGFKEVKHKCLRLDKWKTAPKNEAPLKKDVMYGDQHVRFMARRPAFKCDHEC